jgi:phosphonate transport system substrate-binding protein
VRRSDWYGFPPIACAAATVGSERTEKLRLALLSMHESDLGRKALAALRLDAFAAEPASLFDPVASNFALVRGLG